MMLAAGYLLQLAAALCAGLALGGYAARRAGPPPLLVVIVLVLVSAVLYGIGTVYQLDVRL